MHGRNNIKCWDLGLCHQQVKWSEFGPTEIALRVKPAP
jgi:hypothetical protein